MISRLLTVRVLLLIVATLALSPFFASTAHAAIEIDLSRSRTSIGCDDVVTITADVEDSGVDVVDGTLVQFHVEGVGVGTVATDDGEASIAVSAPAGFVGVLTITATVGGVSEQITVTANCPVAGPPATISLNITNSPVQCANQTYVLATVRDAQGRFVANGTVVQFSAGGSLGSITPSAPVIGSGGVATAVFTAFPRSSGTVQIQARAGDAVVTVSLTITCPVAATSTAAPPPPVIPTVIPTAVAPLTPGIRPPNTGDAGIK